MVETMRSDHGSLFRIGLLSNRPLLAAVVLIVGLQVAANYLPALQTVFQTTALSATDLGISLLLIKVVFWAIELEQYSKRRR
jgi:P-type Ca2+ transporter type 2C